jgi:hypothetical protein
MLTVANRRRHGRAWRTRRAVRIDAATALLISRGAWRMYRGRWPWSAGGHRHRTAWLSRR